MSLEHLNNGWKRFSGGRIWRCQSPRFLCEVDREGNAPSYLNLTSSLNRVRKVKSLYSAKLSSFGTLDANGNALDILTANSMTESFGSAPTPFSHNELLSVYKKSSKGDEYNRLAEVVDYVQNKVKWLVRKEPGYIDPLSTPSRISLGAHHVLLSTALSLLNKQNLSQEKKIDCIKDLIFRLPSVSSYAAELAIKYFNNSYSKHFNEPPLLAASYNAGSLRPDSSNLWNIKQYGAHLDRWIAYYNTSRLISAPVLTTIETPQPSILPSIKKTLELKVVRKEFSEKSTIGEMHINEQFHCYTLEDKYRPNEKKIYGLTAIPKGRYEVIITYSNHFKKNMPLLLNVPNYEGVRIHPGNTDKDTLGCILVGKNKEKDRIGDCKGVYESLTKNIANTLPSGKCYITIQ
jgi:hypothetical protein